MDCAPPEEKVSADRPEEKERRAEAGVPAREVASWLLNGRAPAAVRLAFHLTGDREAALDLSQEAFVKVLEALPRLRDPARFAVWFDRILVNLCRDWRRRRAAERRALAAATSSGRDDAPDPAAETERRETLQRLRAALAGLPAEYREAIALVHLGERSVKDAAGALGVPEGTLSWRLHEGRKMLKESLGLPDEEGEVLRSLIPWTACWAS